MQRLTQPARQPPANFSVTPNPSLVRLVAPPFPFSTIPSRMKPDNTNMKELTSSEMSDIIGGTDPLTIVIVTAVIGYVVANWPSWKTGFANGVLDGYNAATN